MNNFGAETTLEEELIQKDDENNGDEEPSYFLKCLAENSAREETGWVDPKGGDRHIEDTEANAEPNKESLKGMFERIGRGTTFPNWVKEDEAKQEDNQKVRHVFGEES